MIDAKKILDQLLGSGGGFGSPAPTKPHGRPGQPGGYGQNRGNDYGSQSSSGGSAGDILSQVQDLARGQLGGVAGGAIAGTLASVLLGGGKSKGPALGGSAMKLGGLAILGGLAYKAWQNYQQSQSAPQQPTPQAGPVAIAPPPAETPFQPTTPNEEQSLGLLLVRAMIAAARADGRIDGEEISKIREGLKASGADGDEQTFLLEQLGRPDDLDGLVADARGPELGSEVWLAARLTIDPDTAAEQDFLRRLADKLGLDAGLVAHLEATASQAKQSGVSAG
jgi:uncharacterized membrane protein YebE (DUF533 family)